MPNRTFTISLAILSLTGGRDLASRVAPAAVAAAQRPAQRPAHVAPIDDIDEIDGCREEVAPAPRAQVTAASNCGESGSVDR